MVVQFSSVQSLDRFGRRGDMRDDSAEILFQSFLQEALVSSSGMGRDVHSLMLSSSISLPTTASPTPQGLLKDGFGEAVMACDTPELCKFPSLDIARKGFLWTYKEVDLAPHPVISLVFQVRGAEKFPHALDFETMDPFFSESANRLHVSQP